MGQSIAVPAFIRGGTAIAFGLEDSKLNQTVWEISLDGGAAKPLWPHFVGYEGNVASLDGSELLEATRPTPSVLHLGPGGRVTATPVALNTKTMLLPYAFTPDGRAITYVHRQGSVDNLWALPLGGGKPYAITHFKDLEIIAYAFSKDGRLAISRGSAKTDVVLATGLGAKQ